MNVFIGGCALKPPKYFHASFTYWSHICRQHTRKNLLPVFEAQTYDDAHKDENDDTAGNAKSNSKPNDLQLNTANNMHVSFKPHFFTPTPS